MEAPRSMAELEELIKQFYKPQSGFRRKAIDDRLILLQHSKDAWKLADELMASNEAAVRLYAINTFIVKLNRDGPTLDGETAHTVQMRLIYWLVRFVDQNDTKALCEKLCSALTTYFIKSPVHWSQPLLHLALSLARGVAVQEYDLAQSQATVSGLISSLNRLQAQALLWFSSALAHDLQRVEQNDARSTNLHNEMRGIVQDASAVIGWVFAQPVNSTTANTGEALQALLSWIYYAQNAWSRDPEMMQYLQNLTEPALQFLINEDIQPEALKMFRELLDSWSAFFLPQHMHLFAQITYEHLHPKLLQALSDQDPDSEIVGQFVIALGCANIQQIVEQPGDQLGSVAIIQLHYDMLSAGGYPGDDDQLSAYSIEFWNTYIEYVNDVQGSKSEDDDDPEWLPNAKQMMLQAVELIWRKMWTPPKQIADTWGGGERDAFAEFRSDCEDPLLSTFVLCGRDMLHRLVNLTLQSLQANAWRAVEAALFCLNKLADNVLEDISLEDALVNIFRSSIFVDIADFNRPIASQARRTAIDMLGSYSEYIERHPEFLPDTLRFLFASLEMAGLAPPAARSIASLCSTCRAYLTGELPGFLAQYQRFIESKTNDPWTKQKVMGAIAAIVQALKPESAKIEPLLALLEHVAQDAKEAQRYAAEGDMEMAELMGVSSLETLATIGKSMQVPDDVPIDIYDDDEQARPKSNYWDSEEGRLVQERIISCFSVLSVVGTYPAAIDAVCNVLKSGYAETEPGPFVLPPSVTADFLQQCSMNTPSLDVVLSTASVLVTQHSRKDSERVDDVVRSIFNSTTQFMRGLGQPSNDPATAQACIDVYTRLMPRYTSILLEGLDTFNLDFTISAIDGVDSLPKHSACDFWTKLIEPQTAAVSDEVQQQLNQVLQAYGPKLCLALVHQLGGLVTRSDFEYPCKPLKALLLYQSNTGTWLQAALADPSFPSNRVSMELRATFLRMISSTRSDGRKLKEIVRAFWAESMGTVASFSS